ncbi:MAG: hypothetical protein U0Q03_19305 [Acidimicrobiales bacterium]
MTTLNDHGDRPPSMIQCPVGVAPVHSSLTLALRDLRTANGRDEETGDGPGNESWIGLSIGMTVLDTLTKASDPHQQRMLRLLTAHGVEQRDAVAIYHLRNSVLHGYWLPTKTKLGNRRMVLHREQSTYALDTDVSAHEIYLSVPVFCRCLVERIALEAQSNWDATLIDTDVFRKP